uniref:Translation initiation factor eIF2B subunit gamma n=1 Tax=Clastoptera arizonana TaxID=38151 RepID=A0A1B6BX82_9HEMI
MGINEFQAVVMAAGKGSRMTEIVGKKRLKCLLPIGNFPLVWYSLQMLERNGFYDVILVVLESLKTEIQIALEKTGLKLHIDIVSIPEEDWGTADTLRYLEESKKFKSDLVVVSCDLITDVDLSEVLNIFRRHNATLSTLFFNSDTAGSSLLTPGHKSKNKPEQDIVGIDPGTNRLVLLSSESDHEETMVISQNLLRKHGKIRLYSKLLDAHFYVIKRWLCEYLLHNRNVSTIKGELLPYVVKKQFKKITPSKLEPEKNISLVAVHTKKDIIEYAEESNLSTKIKAMSSFNDHRGDQWGPYHEDLIKCYAYIAPKTAFASRVNTLSEFCRVNREIINQWPLLTKKQRTY